MRKTLASFAFAALFWTGTTASAQSRVFKEVGEGIASSMRPIMQDKSMVGYVVFTRLEAASQDSFNYQLTIMDENLNDIGKVKFRDLGMELQAVAFEQDVLALSFIKSKLVGQEFKSGKKTDTKTVENEDSYLHNKFVNLEGKILGTQEEEVETKKDYLGSANSIWRYQVSNRLKNRVQLQNIPGKGFAMYYADERAGHITTFDPQGKTLWTNKTKGGNEVNVLLVSKDKLFLLGKEQTNVQGFYNLTQYDVAAGGASKTQKLTDKSGRQLDILTFENDPNTGLPYATGGVMAPEKNQPNPFRLVHYTEGRYAGFFTMDIAGEKANDMKTVYHYWDNDKAAPYISSKGRLEQGSIYPMIDHGIRGYDGNTYFLGSGVQKRTKWGSVVSSVLTSWTIVAPIIISNGGYTKVKMTEPMVLKQSPDGKLNFAHNIPGNQHHFNSTRAAFSGVESQERAIYPITNPETKTQYVVVDDKNDIFIYNLTQQKLVRTIPHKDGSVRTNIFPAKQGYVMVSEYNKKLRETRYSIEAL